MAGAVRLGMPAGQSDHAASGANTHGDHAGPWQLEILAQAVLLNLLRALVEDETPVDEIAVAPREIVARVQQMLYTAEYKRRQAPPGVKIGTRNFGRDRRYPITNFFHTGPQVKLPR